MLAHLQAVAEAIAFAHDKMIVLLRFARNKIILLLYILIDDSYTRNNKGRPAPVVLFLTL